MALKAGRVGVNPNYVDKEGRPLYDNSYLKELLRKEGIITLFTKEGNPISIDNAVAGHVYDLVVNMAPKQAGTGIPSPSNVRTISGFDSVTVTVNSADTEVTFEDTVYGGTLDLTTGVLTVTHAIITPTAESVGRSSSANCNYADCTPLGTAGDSPTICNMYEQIPAANVGAENKYKIYDIAITLYDDRFTTLEAAQAILDECRIVYQLSTPTTVQLTPAQIALITGSNTVSSDTGTTMDLKYLGTLIPSGANGRSLNRTLSLNRKAVDGNDTEDIRKELGEVSEEKTITKKSTKKSTK